MARREGREWVHGGAEIVQEPRQRKLLRARRAARRWLGLQNQDAASGASRRNGGTQTVGSGSYDQHVGFEHALLASK
jgi:hypothetical protein